VAKWINRQDYRECSPHRYYLYERDYREGWPLLTVETEVNGDSKNTKIQMKGVLSWLVCWACCAGTRDFCSALATLVGPVRNFFFFAG
jgi:hypothetical protein